MIAAIHLYRLMWRMCSPSNIGQWSVYQNCIVCGVSVCVSFFFYPHLLFSASFGHDVMKSEPDTYHKFNDSIYRYMNSLSLYIYFILRMRTSLKHLDHSFRVQGSARSKCIACLFVWHCRRQAKLNRINIIIRHYIHLKFLPKSHHSSIFI